MTESKTDKHTFVVGAYTESPYLNDCIQSLRNQTVKSKILLATSTPNESIRGLAQRYNLPLLVSGEPSGIAKDWNFAYRQADTPYITIAHQDDLYEPAYLETALGYLENAKRPLIFFTDYYERRGEQVVRKNRLLKVKRILLLPLRIGLFKNSRFVRRRCLSFGCPICCPSVTFAKDNLPPIIFEEGFRSNLDWQAWEKLSRQKGAFLYCKTPLMQHRVHEGSETTAVLRENIRGKEDYEMFRKFWPDFIAKKLTKAYSSSEKSNNL